VIAVEDMEGKGGVAHAARVRRECPVHSEFLRKAALIIELDNLRGPVFVLQERHYGHAIRIHRPGHAPQGIYYNLRRPGLLRQFFIVPEIGLPINGLHSFVQFRHGNAVYGEAIHVDHRTQHRVEFLQPVCPELVIQFKMQFVPHFRLAAYVVVLDGEVLGG